jgi:demethylmenaquinone methyltransferase/2-methoxy-6-polyprenyl-1,4-benzoquinol methylase
MLPFGGEKKWRKKMLEPISFSNKEMILEMCCGTGGATYFISDRASYQSKVVAIDLSSGQLKHAKRRKYQCETEFIEGDATNTSFPNNCFDKIFVTHAIHELKRDLRLVIIRESFRLLKRNGQLIILELDKPANPFLRIFIFVWFLYWLPFNFETPTRRDMLKHGLTTEVKMGGFKNIEKFSSYNGLFQTIVGKKAHNNMDMKRLYHSSDSESNQESLKR